MSANHDHDNDPEKKSGHANNLSLTSTSIHGQATGGNHGGYSSSVSEQSISGQNINMHMSNTPLGIGRGQPSQRDGKRNTIQTDDDANATGSLKTSQRGSDSSSDRDTWFPPNVSDTATNSSNQQDKFDRSVMSKGQNAPVTEQDKLNRSVIPKDRPDVKPDQGAIPKVKPAASVFPTAWKDFHVSIKRKEDMKILEQCGCKESYLPPVKMQYLLNFHFKELKTALYDELFKLKWNVKCAIPGDQCLSIEVKNYADDKVLENVILLLGDEVSKVNYCQSMPASKHPELLLKEYLDTGHLAIYVDDEKVFVVGIVEDHRKVTEMLMKKQTSTCTDNSSNAAYTRDIQFNKPFYCQLLEYHQFLPSLKQKHPSVNVAMDEVRSIMSFCGDNHDVQAAVEDVHLFTKDFAVEDIKLDPLLIQLLKLPDIKTFIKELCEKQDLKVIWTLSELNNKITCHCKDRKAVQDLKDVLNHNLEKKTYQYSTQSFGDKTIIFSTTNMFSEFVEKYNWKCLVFVVEGNSMHIFTTRDIGNELTLLEVNFKNTKIDIPKNLTQDEKKDIHGQTSATRKENTTEEDMEVETSMVKVSIPHQKLQMLKKFDFKTHMSRQILDMQVKITDDGIILVSGTERRLNDEIKSFMSMFVFKSFESLPPSVLKFYDNCDIAKKTIDARLEEKRIVCHWYVDWKENSLSVFTPDRKSLSTAESEIFNTVKYTEYSNTDYAKDVLECSAVKSVLEKRKKELTLADFDREEFLVVGLHDAVEEFSKNFERTSERQKPTLPVIKQRFGVSKDFVNCYNKLKSDVCKTLCDLYRVKVEIDQNDEVVVVGSEKQNVQNAVSLLQKEIGKLTKEKWSCEVFDPRDVQAKLQSDIIPSLENRFQCSVSIESNTNLVYQQQLGQWVNWDKGLHLILVHGHMSEMAADVLVCPVSKSLNLSTLGSSMMEKGGSIMKQDLHQKAIIGGQDIYLSSETGNLPCLMMAYLAVPEYKHGVDMKSQVFKCIQELFCSVEKAQLQSLVIPVKLWNDIPETTFLQWFVSALNKNLGQLNALKQIYLCIEDMHKSDVKLKVLSDELLTTWHEYNFEYLIENLQTSLPGKRSSRPAEINISLVKGKLVDQQVDVIVNSNNRDLDLRRGAVSFSIIEKGGKSILKECRERFPNGIDFGEVVCTKAGKMNFKFICHSALPYWTPSAKYSIKILEKLVIDCLMHTQKAQYRSIAFPVFGTGNLLYPWDEVANTMIDTINKYGRIHYDTTIREVKIVLFDKDIKSIQAFETKKKQTEEVKLIPEDPEAPPTFILESRCRNVRVHVIPLSDTTCHHCQAVVKFVTLGQAMKLQKDNPPSNLATDGIVKSKNENSTFWTVTVISDDNEKSYKEAVLKTLVFATEGRIATLAFCLMHSTGIPLKLKVQAKIIRDCIYDLENNRYLQIVKIIVPSRDEFDLMLKDDQFEEHKGFLGVFSSNRPPWKCVRYSDFVEKPRLLISVLGEKKRQMDELKENLQSTIQKLVRKDRDFMNATIRHDSEKGKQDTSTKKWVRVQKQKDRMQMFPLSVEVCKELDNAVKHNHPNVEVSEGVDLFVYKLDDFTYNVNGNDDDVSSGIFYVEGSSDDPQQRNEGEKKMNQTYRQDSQDSKDVFDVVRGKINPVLKWKNEVKAECIEQKMKYDDDTMEVEGTLEQLTSLNQYLSTRFEVERGLSIEQKQEPLPRKTRQAPHHPNQQADDVERKSEINLTDMEYKMLKFYCREHQVFKRKYKYENGMLIIYLDTNETEQEFQLTIQSKLTHFNSMTSFDVVLQDTTIDDDQLRKIEQEIPPDIFCYLSKDRKTLTLKGSNYEKLSVAKNKSELILGLQKKTNNARRNRVIKTDPDYEDRKDKTPENRSFHQSINYSRSSSENFSGSSRTYNSQAVKDLSYMTPEGLVVKVYVGSILHLTVNCIVNAANENLMHGGGVAEVISRAAGYDFQKESDDYIQNNGPLSVTECCTTSAGNLQQYQCVIHAVGPKWYDYPYDKKRACADDLQKTILNCFKEAEIKNVSSVALPAISSGIFGVPKEVCCSEYCKAVIEYSNTCGKTTCLKEIHFMDKEPGMIQMIQAEFSLHLNMTQSASASGNTGPNPSTSTTNAWSRDGKGRLSRSFSDDTDKKHHHDDPSSGNAESNTSQIASSTFQKQYIAGKDLRINIVQEDITKMTVDIIVCPQDDFCHSKGGIAKAISKVSNEWYRSAVFGMKRVSKCEVRKIKASPASLPFKGVLQTVAPRWDKHAVKDNKTFMKELSLTIRNIVQHCSDSGTVNSVAIPVLGVGADGNKTPYVTYASSLANEISKAMKSDKFSLTEIYIVTHDWSMASAIADHFDTVDSFKKVTSYKGRNRNKDKKVVKAGDKEQSKDDFQASGNRGDVKLGTTVRHGGLENCVICMDKLTAPRKLRCGHIFCEECIGQQFKVKPVCPTCGSIQGIVTGDQPPGQIKMFSSRASLPGYPQCGRIHIEYTIYGGIQGTEHPNPGRSFEGIQRTAYLPDNTRGQLITKLLKLAFDRKLVFTIGHSRTTGKQGVVTWNDIHHKTNPQSDAQFGYPDPTYFDRVIDELAAKGVTEKDIYTKT